MSFDFAKEGSGAQNFGAQNFKMVFHILKCTFR